MRRSRYLIASSMSCCSALLSFIAVALSSFCENTIVGVLIDEVRGRRVIYGQILEYLAIF